MKPLIYGFWILFVVTQISTVFAHEVRPAYLQIKQVSNSNTADVNDQVFQIIWKQPVLNGKRLRLIPQLPNDCIRNSLISETISSGASLKSWKITCNKTAFFNSPIIINGLSSTLVDVFVSIEYLNGKTASALLNPSQTKFKIEADTLLDFTGTFWLGLTHLLSGIDHILFILGLMFFSRGFYVLLKTVTAFTLAHSITLAASVFNIVQLSQPPVEAAIALSVLFLAYEASSTNEKQSLVYRKPWLIAFIFGLLHGFGFASALMDIGLSETATAAALLFFNLGVEVGQIILISVILIGISMISRWQRDMPDWILKAPIYVVGSVTSFWLLQRLEVIVNI